MKALSSADSHSYEDQSELILVSYNRPSKMAIFLLSQQLMGEPCLFQID